MGKPWLLFGAAEGVGFWLVTGISVLALALVGSIVKVTFEVSYVTSNLCVSSALANEAFRISNFEK
jgi:hypothetical protein